MKRFNGFEKGMGIGGWLTNYKRFNVLPMDKRLTLTVGDFEHFNTYITEQDVKNIADMGMDHIRVGFDQIVLEEEPYCYRDEIFNLLGSFVGWCEKYHLNVVLNLHKAIGNYCDIEEKISLLDSTELQNRFIALWLKIEDFFADRLGVAFELLNEVRDVDCELWNNLAQKTIEEIRKRNKTRKIIVGSTCWNAPEKLRYLRLYDDENIIYTFHMYAPFSFTHQQGVLQWPTLYYNRKMAYPGDIEPYRDYERVVYGNDSAYADFEKMDKKTLLYFMQGAIDFVAEHPDKILWCGEFGTIRHCNITYRENWMRDVISILKENDIPYSVWNYLSTPNDGNRFSLVDDETRKILSENMLHIIRGEV